MEPADHSYHRRQMARIEGLAAALLEQAIPGLGLGMVKVERINRILYILCSHRLTDTSIDIVDSLARFADAALIFLGCTSISLASYLDSNV